MEHRDQEQEHDQEHKSRSRVVYAADHAARCQRPQVSRPIRDSPLRVAHPAVETAGSFHSVLRDAISNSQVQGRYCG